VATPISSVALVLVGSVIGSLGAIFLKSGAHALTRRWTKHCLQLETGCRGGHLPVVLGPVCQGMTNGELSVLFPMVSVGYICSLLWSHLFFKERVTKAKLAGVGLILVGIIFLGFGNAAN